MNLFFLTQNPNIAEKVKNAPDSGYEIGLVIGSYLPFAVLVLIAYLLYYFAKKRNKNKPL